MQGLLAIPAPFGWIEVRGDAQKVMEIRLHGTEVPCPRIIPKDREDLQQVKKDLEDYLEDPSHRPTGSYLSWGTPYQQRVWRVIELIGCGETRSYLEIAEQLGSGPRAVAGACRQNPYPLLIPCHRVVGVRGIGGFCGQREGSLVAIKRWLIAHDQGRASPPRA